MMDDYDAEIISDHTQIESCWKGFNEYRKNGKLVDLTLILPDQSEFKVHKNIMALGCPYFAAMFDYNDLSRKDIINAQNDDDEKVENSEVDGYENDDTDTTNNTQDLFKDDIVKIKREISAEIFEKIIEFIYTGEIKISSLTAPILHENAVFFNLLHLKKICTSFLIKSFQIETCLTYWRKSAFNNNLEENCFDFIARNCELFLERYIMDLTYEEIKKIASSTKTVCAEEKLYKFIIQWVKSDYENRSEKLKLLLSDLRYIMLTSDNIFNIIINDLSINDLCIKLLNEFKEKSNFATTNSELMYQLNPPRIGFRPKNFTVVTKNSIYNYDEDKWRFDEKHNFEEGFNINSFGENYLLFSGGGDNELSKTCQFYCPVLNSFKSFPATNKMRKFHGILSLNNKIYSCGGKHSMNTMEIFDLNSGYWIEGPSTIKKHYDFGITSDDNCIYVVDGNSSSFIVERFDPRQNKWTKINDIPEIFNFNRSIVLDDKIYCFIQDGIITLDLRLNEWLPKMPCDLYGNRFDVNLFDKEIYIFGRNGSNGMFKLNLESKLLTKLPDFSLELPNATELPDCYLELPNAEVTRLFLATLH